MTPHEHDQFQRLVQKIDPQNTLLRAWEMEGGVSAQVMALEVQRPGGETARMIVRRHGPADLAGNPSIAEDEFRLLKALHSAGLPVPEPYYVDRSAEIFTTPCIVVEYIEGQPESEPADVGGFVRELATQLARIHRLDYDALDLSFLPRQEERLAARLAARRAAIDADPGEKPIWETLAAASPLKQLNAPLLLHGDFWPGNLLWRDGQLVAIIDWEDAAIGDPLADLANSRLEILWALGTGAMHEFTARYRSLMPAVDIANLPYHDLYVAARAIPMLSGWDLAEADERTMRERLDLFIAQAYEMLREAQSHSSQGC